MCPVPLNSTLQDNTGKKYCPGNARHKHVQPSRVPLTRGVHKLSLCGAAQRTRTGSVVSKKKNKKKCCVTDNSKTNQLHRGVARYLFLIYSQEFSLGMSVGIGCTAI